MDKTSDDISNLEAVGNSETEGSLIKTEVYGPVQPATNVQNNNNRKLEFKYKKALRGMIWFLGSLFLLLHFYLIALRFLPSPFTLNMLLSSEPLKREIIPLTQISPNLISAVIAAEDTRFCQHNGIDFEGLKKAIEDNQTRSRRRGGSTLSQQTAKNLIFWNGGGYLRKAGEAYVTLFIELIWPKDKIMEHYLNIADWGDGIYGAEAASKIRFGKSASELTIREAALLAAVLPSPHKWRVDPPGEYVRQRVGTIQTRMSIVNSEGLDLCAQP